MPQPFLITPDRAEETAEVLSQAFMKESATDFFFPPEEGDKLPKLRALFGWAMEYRIATGVPALAVTAPDGRIAGAVTLRLPGESETPPIVEALWAKVEQIIGPESSARIDLYDQAQKTNLHPEPHHYIVAIGVHPDFQGKGYGGDLLRAAIDYAESDRGSSGIGLDTGTEENQRLYEKFGFRLFATAQLGAKTARYMFRPNAS